jgi:hypothetical protein
MPPCKTSVAAGMPAPLAEYVEPDAHGYPIFSYPAQVGRLLGELSHINRMMASAMTRCGPCSRARWRSLNRQLPAR